MGCGHIYQCSSHAILDTLNRFFFAVAKFGRKVKVSRSGLVAGSWNHVPSGCSVQSGGDWAANYNRKANKVGDASYTSVFA